LGLLERLGLSSGASTIRVQMIASVDSHVAGEKYDLDTALADRYILRGYASGNLSREYTDSEVRDLTVNSQVVGI
jgi:hypothetical protein